MGDYMPLWRLIRFLSIILKYLKFNCVKLETKFSIQNVRDKFKNK